MSGIFGPSVRYNKGAYLCSFSDVSLQLRMSRETSTKHTTLISCAISSLALVVARGITDGSSVLGCDVAFIVDGSEIVLPSPLNLDSVVTCNGTHVLTATDVDNLERRSGGIVTAVDQYNKEVSATATAVVMFEQVSIQTVADRGRRRSSASCVPCTKLRCCGLRCMLVFAV